MSNISLPVLHQDDNLSRYLSEVRRIPFLKEGEEFALARKWRDENDSEAAHKLVTSHLRLVARIAMGYRGYGLPMSELISEGNIGLMQAVKRYDPERGFKLATYAMWWIKASIQEYILHSWSLVKIGTTAGQKKLFFSLRSLKARLYSIDGKLPDDHIKQIADQLNVSENEVMQMEQRIAGRDHSLNAPVSFDGDQSGEWQDWLEDDTIDQEEQIGNAQELSLKRGLLNTALSSLNEREQYIINARRLSEEPQTLEVLSHHFDISRERVRQIEARAFEKLQAHMIAAS